MGISFLTKEQNAYYDTLNDKQKQYVKLRGEGLDKKEAYRLSGWGGRHPTQAASVLESRNPLMVELIQVFNNNRKVNGLSQEVSEINKEIDKKVKQADDANALATIATCDAETARRIQFYRDVINGKVFGKKITRRYDKDNVLIERKVEEITSVEAKMTARKELDRILGINQIIDLDQIKVKDITINIVDASRREEKVEGEKVKAEVVEETENADTDSENKGDEGEWK